MINVKLIKKNSNIISFEVNNHAMPEERDFHHDAALVGEAFDMICNSVSVLSQSVLIGIDEVLKLNCTYEMSEGYLKLDLSDFTFEELQETQVLLKTFEKSLESVMLSLEEMFGKEKRREYITLKIEEV
jgi:hypothetical protein